MAPNMKHARSNDQAEQDVVTVETTDNKQNSHTEQSVPPASDAPPARRRPRRPDTLRSFIPPHLRNYVFPYHGDFCFSLVFHAQLVAQVMAEGFLPIATENYLLPKLHQQRCVILLPDHLHISKSVRKKSKHYHLTVNQAFDDVVQGCRHQHGPHCWLYAPLVQAFQQIHQLHLPGMLVRTSTRQQEVCPVRLYSIEVWDNAHNHLVAGELGYTVGSIYTSLTGFSNQDSAGSVQLAALGRLLCQSGFTIWDLGMDMEYKRTLGSQLMARPDFCEAVHRVRVSQGHTVLPLMNRNCKDIIDNVVNPNTPHEPGASHNGSSKDSKR